MESKSTLQRVGSELSFVWHMVRLNLASLMEYRASFLTQAIGMFINNGIYFVFWLLFFDRFSEIRGYQIEQIYLLFAIVALGWGIAFTLAGNANRMAELIAQGRLDYYLTLPRPVLPHLLFSSMNAFAIGDLTFGVIAFMFAGRFDVLSILLFLVSSSLAAVIFVTRTLFEVSYSREAEKNADEFAIGAMHALGRSPAPMGELLFRTTGAERSGTIGILASHPLTEDRRELMRQQDRPATGPEILSNGVWQALKTICRPANPQ